MLFTMASVGCHGELWYSKQTCIVFPPPVTSGWCAFVTVTIIWEILIGISPTMIHLVSMAMREMESRTLCLNSVLMITHFLVTSKWVTLVKLTTSRILM